MGEAKRRRELGLPPKVKKRPKKRRYFPRQDPYQTLGKIVMPGLRY